MCGVFRPHLGLLFFGGRGSVTRQPGVVCTPGGGGGGKVVHWRGFSPPVVYVVHDFGGGGGMGIPRILA